MMMTLTIMIGQLHAETHKTPPPDVGPGRVAWFDITTTDLPRAKEFYGKLFAFTLRGHNERNAFIDIGDQFINLTRETSRGPVEGGAERRHIGIVVDDRSSVRARARRPPCWCRSSTANRKNRLVSRSCSRCARRI